MTPGAYVPYRPFPVETRGVSLTPQETPAKDDRLHHSSPNRICPVPYGPTIIVFAQTVPSAGEDTFIAVFLL